MITPIGVKDPCGNAWCSGCCYEFNDDPDLRQLVGDENLGEVCDVCDLVLVSVNRDGYGVWSDI